MKHFLLYHAPALVALALILLYLPVLLWGTWQFDDGHSIVDNPFFRDWHNIPRFFTGTDCFSMDPAMGMYRPVLLLSYWATHALFGMEVWGWHLVNLLIHLGSAFVVWRLFGGWPALFFAFSPIAVEPVAYVSARSDGLMVLFSLLAGWALWRSWRAAIELGGRNRAIWLRWASVGFMALAMLTKETAVVLPVFMVIWYLDFYGWKNWELALWNAWRHLAAAGLYLLTLFATGFLGRSLAHPARGAWDQLYTQIHAACYYAFNLFCPVHLSIYPVGIAHLGTMDFIVMGLGGLVIGGLVFLALGAGNCLPRLTIKKDPVVLFAILWMVLALLPVMVMPLNMEINCRRMYYPLIGSCVLWAHLLKDDKGWFRHAWLGMLVMFAVTGTLNWSDPVSLWIDASRKNPESAAVKINLGDAFRQKAQAGEPEYWHAAEQAYTEALHLGGQAALAYNNLGSICLAQGQLVEAERLYLDALAFEPDNADALANVGTVYHERARRGVEVAESRRQALEWYARALDRNAFHRVANRNAGLLLQDLGMQEEAQFYLEQANRVRSLP